MKDNGYNVLLLYIFFVAEVRAANERLYPDWVRIVISREDAKKIGFIGWHTTGCSAAY